ncbi:MAG: diguanylate cyclase [Pseudomonadota bacterium]
MSLRLVSVLRNGLARQRVWLAGLLAFLWCALALAAADPVGLSAAYLLEREGRLDLSAAVAAREAGAFTPGGSPVLNFGIGAPPVWVHFTVDNPGASPLPRTLTIATAWLDRIELHVRHQGETVSIHRVGDLERFGQRPVTGRYFAFEHAFAPGTSEVYLRVETPDPLVLPIHMEPPEAAQQRELLHAFSYGGVYGFLIALMAYNAILYVSLRSRRYLLYAGYLAAFVAMNVAYTGHGYAWLWPESPAWQQWSNPVLMLLYGVSGLAFAIRFLDLQVYYPRVRRVVIAFCAIFSALMAAAILAGSQVAALWVAFGFVFLFAAIMIFLGVISVQAGQKPAKYFLMAAVAGMLGAVLTALSTSGFIPYNAWTFRAAELGMLVDATLLALALGYQFRVGQEERVRAERLAHLDPLTGVNNRRAFYDKTRALWSNAQRHGHDVAVMLLDIDRFKQINDAHGHAQGDAVLRAVTDVLRQSVRQGDVLARWGGEEFIVFMPDTSLREAIVLAERLREAIAVLRVPAEAGETAVTVSVGVAQKEDVHGTLDALIAIADECLYHAKAQGRNQVTDCQSEQIRLL